MIAHVPQRLINILLADDGSENMRPAIQLLTDLPHESDCMVTALRVFTPLEGAEYSRVETEAEKTKNLLKSRHFHYRSELIQGYPAETIQHYAEEHSPDLIVMGGKATGTLGGLLGNVASDVIHSGRWPVLIMRGPYDGLKRVLLVSDGSEASQFTGEYLRQFPLPSSTEIELMHVVEPVRVSYPIEPGGLAVPTITAEDEARINKDNLERGKLLLEKARMEMDFPGDTHLVLEMGDPVKQILAHTKAKNIDLLVCGSRGAGNLTGWLMGSISRELVQLAPCPVLVVRNPNQG